MYDCGFTKENNWFRYRAAAIIVENDCVLFAGNENEDYFYSIGGGVHMGETAEDAVLREVYEETGVHYEIERLAVIHENFFDENNGMLKGLNCHEICFYFLMKPRGTQELHSNSTTCGVKEEMHWLPIKELDKYKAFPSFMKDYLSKEHFGIEHIVTDERSVGATRMDEYAKRAKEQWGQTAEYKEYEEKTNNQSSDTQTMAWKNLMLIFSEFGKMKDKEPEHLEVQVEVKKLQDYISEHFYKCSNEVLRGLGAMYSSGGEFTENIDNAAGSGTAVFVAKAIDIYCS